MSKINRELLAMLNRTNAETQAPAALSWEDQKWAERIDEFAQLTPGDLDQIENLIVDKMRLAIGRGHNDDILVMKLAQAGFNKTLESLRLLADLEGGAE